MRWPGARAAWVFDNPFLKPIDAVAHVLRAGIIGPIGKPKRNVGVVQFFCDGDGFQNVIESLLTDRGIRITERTKLVTAGSRKDLD